MLLVALVLPAAACSGGGGDEGAEMTVPEYEAVVVSTRDRVDFALARITSFDPERPDARDELLDRMDEASVAIEEAASDFEEEAAAPPEEWKDETEQLTGSLHQLSVDLAAVASDVRNQIVEAPPGLNFESWENANLALAGLIADGLDVKLIGNH